MSYVLVYGNSDVFDVIEVMKKFEGFFVGVIVEAWLRIEVTVGNDYFWILSCTSHLHVILAQNG